jgi:hypothetical protein
MAEYETEPQRRKEEARVHLASRHVQESASLGLVDEAAFRYLPDAAA